MSFWIFHHFTTGNTLCKLKVKSATTTFTDPESRRPNKKTNFSLQFLICFVSYILFNIFKKKSQQKNIIISLAFNLKGGGGEKKIQRNRYFFQKKKKKIDTRIYSDKIDTRFCSDDIDNCWEDFGRLFVQLNQRHI